MTGIQQLVLLAILAMIATGFIAISNMNIWATQTANTANITTINVIGAELLRGPCLLTYEEVALRLRNDLSHYQSANHVWKGLTALMVIKIAVTSMMDNLEVYSCPESPAGPSAWALIVSDESGSVCAIAIVSQTQTVPGSHAILTAYYDSCKHLRQRMIRRGCIRITSPIRFVFQ